MVSWTLPVTVYAEGIRVTKEFTHKEAAIASTKFKMQKSLWLLEYKVAMAPREQFLPTASPAARLLRPTLLDEMGRLAHPVQSSDIASWKNALRSAPPLSSLSADERKTLAQEHIWVGEYELAHDQEPLEAHRHFKRAYDITNLNDPLHGLAAYDSAVAVYDTHNFTAGAAVFHHLLVSRPVLAGYDRGTAALWMRHAAACAGYHAEHARLGIPEPPRIDPLCGAASLAASLRAMGLPYGKGTVLKSCRMTEEGSGLKDIVGAGPSLGVSVRPVVASAHALLALPKPLIAFVERDHFVSVTRADKSGVTYLCSDCGAWPGGAVHLSWKQWNAMAPGVYAAVVKPGRGWDRFFVSLPDAQKTHARTADAQLKNSIQVASIGSLAGMVLAHNLIGLTTLAVDNYVYVVCALNPQSQQCPCPACCPTAGGGSGSGGSGGSGSGGGGGSLLISQPGPMSSPTAGDPVNLATGEEEYTPAPDITVYNPHGPSVSWSRIYNSLRQTLGSQYGASQSDDFGSKWSQTYNVGVWEPYPGATQKYIYQANGALISFVAPSVPSATNLHVKCTVQPGVPMLVEWDYATATGSTFFTITLANRTKWITTGLNQSNYAYLLSQIVDRNGNAITFNYAPAQAHIYDTTQWPLLSSIVDNLGQPLLVINRAQDGSGNITSIDDRYGRSVYYHVGYQEIHPDGNYWNIQQVDRVSQITPTDPSQRAGNPQDRYAYGYTQVNVYQAGAGAAFSYLTSISVPNPSGTPGVSTATISYDDTNLVTGLTDPNSNTVSVTPVNSSGNYSFSSNLTQVKVSSGSTAQYTYTVGFDSNMNQTGRTDGNNVNVSSTVYDGANPFSPKTVTNGNGNVWTYTYDNSAGYYENTATVVSPRGVTTAYTWSYPNGSNPNVFPMGELTKTQQSYVSSGTTYYKTPTLYSYEDTKGYYDSYNRFTPSGYLKTAMKPTPGSILTSPSGTVGTPSYVTYTYLYDSLGDLTQMTTPGNNATLTGTPPNQTDQGITTTFNYGSSPAIGQMLSMTDNLGHSTYYTYDSEANKTSQTDALGNTTYFGNTSGLSGYNIANQQILITYPATGQTGSGHGRMTMTYLYPGGPLTGEQNYDEGNTPGPIRSVATSYGMEGETLGVTGSTEPAAYTYDALYRLHSLTDGNNQTTYYFYNATGYRVQTVYPGGYTTAPTAPLAAGSPDTITNTTFDTIGQVTASVDGRGVTTTYTYTSDPESKLTNVHYTIPNGSTVTPLSDTVIQYDPYGRISTVGNGVTSVAYGYTSGTTYPGYDDADHVLNIQTSYLNSAGTATLFSKALSYGYYNDGSAASMGTPAGTFTYAYDGAGRPTSLTNPFSETTSWGYQNNNWLSSETLPNAVTATYTRNVAGEITDLSNKLSGQSTALSDFGTMTYDGVGNRTSVTASLPGAPSTYSGTTAYGYDTRNELTQETRTGSGTGNYSNAFSYDSAENPQVFRSEPATGANSFSVDNQTTAFTGPSGSSLGTFGYDGNGNPTTYKGATLTFDPENRMTGYGSVLTNGYGPDDLRAWKQGASGATYFLYSNMNQPVCEFNASGTLTATNTYGHVGLVSRRVSSTSTFYTFDPQGSVAQRLNSSGGIVSSDTGDAFGSRATTGSGDVFGYIGQWGYYSDGETGLSLCQHRYYDPATGRFVNRDPIGYNGGVNLYNYCQNNAVNCADSSGYASLIPGNPYLQLLEGLASCVAAAVGDTAGRNSFNFCSDIGACVGAIVVSVVDALNPDIAEVPEFECLANAGGSLLGSLAGWWCQHQDDPPGCAAPPSPCEIGNWLGQAVAGCGQGVASAGFNETAGKMAAFICDQVINTLASAFGGAVDENCSQQGG